jgi:hypothetical protein
MCGAIHSPGKQFTSLAGKLILRRHTSKIRTFSKDLQKLKYWQVNKVKKYGT